MKKTDDNRRKQKITEDNRKEQAVAGMNGKNRKGPDEERMTGEVRFKDLGHLIRDRGSAGGRRGGSATGIGTGRTASGGSGNAHARPCGRKIGQVGTETRGRAGKGPARQGGGLRGRGSG